MRFRLATIAILSMTTLMVGPPATLAQQKEQPKQQKKAPEKAKQASLTGCVDQQDGQYVLIHDQNRELIAKLEADGFPTDGFAKHVGHKVTVRGTSGPSDASGPIFKVRSVETVTESCAPHEN